MMFPTLTNCGSYMLQQNRHESNVAMPPAPIWVPSQLSFALSILSVPISFSH